MSKEKAFPHDSIVFQYAVSGDKTLLPHGRFTTEISQRSKAFFLALLNACFQRYPWQRPATSHLRDIIRLNLRDVQESKFNGITFVHLLSIVAECEYIDIDILTIVKVLRDAKIHENSFDWRSVMWQQHWYLLAYLEFVLHDSWLMM